MWQYVTKCNTGTTTALRQSLVAKPTEINRLNNNDNGLHNELLNFLINIVTVSVGFLWKIV